MLNDRFLNLRCKYHLMEKAFKVGDHVTWNSEAGRVSGHIVRVHTKDVDYKGYVHHASKDDPQYEIKSDKTDHIAAHKGSTLKLSALSPKIGRRERRQRRTGRPTQAARFGRPRDL